LPLLSRVWPIAKKHYKISLADALDGHQQALERFGGLRGIRDIGSVESAIARPYTGYYKKIEEKAAALVESMVRNHGFTDGNKRTALYLLNILLDRSDYRLAPLPGEDLNISVARMIEDFAKRDLNKPQLIDWLRRRILRKL
jgi:death-on-curing protein